MSRKEWAAVIFAALTAINVVALILWTNEPKVSDNVVLYDNVNSKCWALTIIDNSLVGKPVECPGER